MANRRDSIEDVLYQERDAVQLPDGARSEGS